MKIFISWSGETSKELAIFLKSWLSHVIQKVEPFISTHDIDRGKKWFSEIGSQLEATNFCIVCLTEENRNEPWILFEAGAVSKSTETSRVVPLLINFPQSQLQGPLAQFNAVLFERDGFEELVKSINKLVEGRTLDDASLAASFSKWWPDLEKKREEILQNDKARKLKKGEPDQVPPRPTEDILEEILEIVRDIRRDQPERGGPKQRIYNIAELKELFDIINMHGIRPFGGDPSGGDPSGGSPFWVSK